MRNIDIEQLIEWFELTGNSEIRLRQIGKSGSGIVRDIVTNLEEIAGWFNSSPVGLNTFASPNGCMRGEQFERAYVVFGEIDKDKDGNIIPHEKQGEIMRSLNASGALPRPWFAVRSKKSIHWYWRLSEPLLDADKWSRIQSAIAYTLGGDPSLSDVNQLMRVPGLPYHTGDDSLMVKLMIADRNRELTDISEFDIALEAHKERIDARHNKKTKPVHNGSKLLSDDLLERAIYECEDPEILFNWHDHNFQYAGNDKWRGDCPKHDSESGTSFWVQFNDNENWDWGCPVCTENVRGNVYSYRHWLTSGKFEQPKKDKFAVIKNQLAKELEVDINQDDLFIAMQNYHDLITTKGGYSARKYAKDNCHKVDMSVGLFESTYDLWLEEVIMNEEDLRIPTLAERVENLNQEDIDIIPGWIRKGELTLVTGDSGSGKSSLLGDVIHGMIHGGNVFARRLEPQPGNILLINSDESAMDTSNRLKLRGTDVSRVMNIEELGLDKGGIARLNKIITLNKPNMVIVDSLTSVTQGGDGDENHPKFANYLYQLKELAKKHNLPILVVHHNNKTGKVSGTRRLVAPCWSVISVDYPPGYDPEGEETTQQRIIQTRKCRGGQRQRVSCKLKPMMQWGNGIFEYSNSDLFINTDQRQLILRCADTGSLEIPKKSGEIRDDSLSYETDLEALLIRGFLVVGNGILTLSPRGENEVKSIRGI
jgi:archaellum biogenesis ATPase FlaH